MSNDPKCEAQPGRKFQFIGGELCLDFCNTVGGKRGARTKEFLNTYADFLSWCEQAGLAEPEQAAGWRRRSARAPAEAAAVLARAVELREALYTVFAALAERRSVPAVQIEKLNTELARALGRLRVSAHKGRFKWQWAADDDSLDQPLGPVARSAAELLVGDEGLKRVRRCEGDNCGWLFIDSSKNHSRRWCDMRDCGNRAKVRRHRLKAAGRSDGN